MKELLLIGFAIAAMGCRNEVEPTEQSIVMVPDSTIDRPTISFKDPAIYGGANILACFMAELRAQQYNEAINITAPSSIKLFGRKKIRDYYEKLDFNYHPVLLSIHRSEGDTCELKYSVLRYATGRFVIITTVVVRDSCRILLPEKLDAFLR